jgi:hypothetical protein
VRLRSALKRLRGRCLAFGGMPRRHSSGSLFALRPGAERSPENTRPTDPPADHDDTSPASEVRPAAAPPRYLTIATWLRGADAEGAWVTVTGAEGTIYFEGPLLPDGRVTVAIDSAPSVRCVCVRLETLRWHRQAEVTIESASNAYAFT